MNINEWFSVQMGSDKLICRVNILSPKRAYMEFWTRYQSDDDIWGGARITYRTGTWFNLDMTYFPPTMGTYDCALEAVQDWGSRVGWTQQRLVVLRRTSKKPSQLASSNPLVLQYLRFAQGVLAQESQNQTGYESSLCRRLAIRIEGLADDGTRELAKLLTI